MALIQNNLGEFVDNYDPYETDRKKIYANCHVDTKHTPSMYEPRKRKPAGVVKTCAYRKCGRKFRTFNVKQMYCSIRCKERESYYRKRDRLIAKRKAADDELA